MVNPAALTSPQTRYQGFREGTASLAGENQSLQEGGRIQNSASREERSVDQESSLGQWHLINPWEVTQRDTRGLGTGRKVLGTLLWAGVAQSSGPRILCPQGAAGGTGNLPSQVTFSKDPMRWRRKQRRLEWSLRGLDWGGRAKVVTWCRSGSSGSLVLLPGLGRAGNSSRKPQKPRNREKCQTKPHQTTPNHRPGVAREILLPQRGNWELHQPLLGMLEARPGQVRCYRPKRGQKWVRQRSN